jgi:predicted GTPase
MASKQLSAREVEALRSEILREVASAPPTVGVIGVSGVGKSSTVNALFKTSLAISHTVACTKRFTEVDLAIQFKSGHAKDLPASLRICDAPGLGEDIRRDPEYLQMYVETLPTCDAIIWVTAARNRAISLDQQYLQALTQFHDRIVVGINQIDLVDPMDWNRNTGLPSPAQQQNIEEICADRAERFASVIGRKVSVVPYSAETKFNLEELFGRMIDACPEKRRWVLDALKGFHYTDFLPAGIRERFLKEGKV